MPLLYMRLSQHTCRYGTEQRLLAARSGGMSKFLLRKPSSIFLTSYRPKGSPDTAITIKFDDPQEGVSPGQVAAVYDIRNEWCMGSGIISNSLS